MGAAAELDVRLQPRASRPGVAGEHDGRVVIRVAEPPVEGAANAALCRLIAKRAGVARGRVSVVRGERSRNKTLRVEGIGVAQLRSRLGLD